MKLGAVCLLALVLLTSLADAQPPPINQQGWQSKTIASDAVNISCSELILPSMVGRLLDETNPTMEDGELAHSIRGSYEIKLLLHPQSGISDILTNITGCYIDGTKVIVSTANTGETVVLTHSTGGIEFADHASVVLDTPLKTWGFILKSGVWVSMGGAGGGATTVFEGQKLDMAAVDMLHQNEGLILPTVNNCSAAITRGQVCPDFDDQIIYIGDGTGIKPFGIGAADICADLGSCATQGKVIDGLDSEEDALVLKSTDGTAIKFFAGSQGFDIKCVTDYGTEAEASCVPSQVKTAPMPPGAMSVDGAYCVRQYDVAFGTAALPIPVSITCADNNGASIYLFFTMPDSWDGTHLIMTSFLHTKETSPNGDIKVDWSGYCVANGAPNAVAGWGSETSMLIDLDGNVTNDLIITNTAGDVPVVGCTGTGTKALWLRGQVDAPGTTADDLGAGEILSDQYFIAFKGEYGLKANSDN